mmetsp:Transcript_6448/g.10637  ORF Transcript_6448/g.10637 Transcript_6448/m.10637 type:complete len:90 (+) Transcript_6448:117-386(+)
MRRWGRAALVTSPMRPFPWPGGDPPKKQGRCLCAAPGCFPRGLGAQRFAVVAGWQFRGQVQPGHISCGWNAKYEEQGMGGLLVVSFASS